MSAMSSVPATERGFASVTIGERQNQLAEAEKLDFSGLVAELRATFNSGKTKSLEWRKHQLSQLQLMVKENFAEFSTEFMKDHAGPKIRSFFEIAPFVGAGEAIANLEKWAAPIPVKHKGLSPTDIFNGKSYIKKEPKGVVLIISPWNYPILLTLDCMIGALAAGNCCVIKPSEVSAHSCEIMAKLIPKYFDPSAVRVVTGGVPETTALLRERYDHIIYTGNGAVGRVVMAAAAKHLTPCTLELGGKSPTYVDKSAKMDVAVERVSAAKWINAGQTCIAPDYVLVHRDIAAEFKQKTREHIKKYFGENVKSNQNYGRVINDRHVQRVNALVQNTSGKVVAGGDCDAGEHYHAPTIVEDPSIDDSVMQEEIFGPVLPIMVVDSVEDAVARVNKICDHPLALYVFAQDQGVIDYYVNNTTSGGVCVNSCMEHNMNPNLPFGGVGESGMGSYHGVYGFDEFSHMRSVFVKDTVLNKGWVLPPPPYSDGLFDLAVKARITGFLSDGQRQALKAGGVAAAAFLAYRFSSRL